MIEPSEAIVSERPRDAKNWKKLKNRDDKDGWLCLNRKIMITTHTIFIVCNNNFASHTQCDMKAQNWIHKKSEREMDLCG